MISLPPQNVASHATIHRRYLLAGHNPIYEKGRLVENIACKVRTSMWAYSGPYYLSNPSYTTSLPVCSPIWLSRTGSLSLHQFWKHREKKKTTIKKNEGPQCK